MRHSNKAHKKAAEKIKLKFKIYLMLQSITKNGFAKWGFGTMMMEIPGRRESSIGELGQQVRRRNVAFRGRGAHRNERQWTSGLKLRSVASGDGAAEKNSSAKWKSALSWLKHSRASYLIEKYRSRLEPRRPYREKSKEIRAIQAQSAPRFDQNQHCVPLGRLFWAAVYQQRGKHD